MSAQFPWYEIISETELSQGDLLEACPILVPKVPATLTEGAKAEIEADLADYDIVVMSQTCDLVQGKLDLVLVAPHWSLEEIASQNTYLGGKQGREDLRRGNIPGYHLLNRCDLSGHECDFRVVDFRNLHSLPVQYLTELAKERNPRLRLLPPYREHLAQAFARFFMRVGLPIDIPPFR